MTTCLSLCMHMHLLPKAPGGYKPSPRALCHYNNLLPAKAQRGPTAAR